MKKLFLLFCMIFQTLLLSDQPITWTEITTQFSSPNGLKIFKGERANPKLVIWYMDVDLNEKNLALKAYLGDKTNVKNFTKKVGAYAAINGGYFGGNTSVSAVIYPDGVKGTNIASVTRNNKSYPLIRSLFSVKKDRSSSVNWIYHYGSLPEDIYCFDAPIDYDYLDPTPREVPLKSAGNSSRRHSYRNWWWPYSR